MRGLLVARKVTQEHILRLAACSAQNIEHGDVYCVDMKLITSLFMAF